MFHWLKRQKSKSSILENWDFYRIPDFNIVYNPDSIQYVNRDESIVIYFSVLTVGGSDLFNVGAHDGKPTITEIADGWQLKGTKKSKLQLLVCVISIVNREDIEWAQLFFDSINSK